MPPQNACLDYDIQLYDSNLNVVESSQRGGCTQDDINYSATPGTYLIRVYGIEGAFHETETYQLSGTWPAGCTGFNEQFNSGNAANWTRDSGTWNVVNSKWYTCQAVNDIWNTSTYNDDTYSNVDYSGRFWRGGTFGANSLIVRSGAIGSGGGPDDGYFFQYAVPGYYSVWKRVAGVSTALQNWTESSAINTGAAWNVLRVVANGPTFKFYINGTLVWSGADGSHSQGRVGMRFISVSEDKLWVDWARLVCLQTSSFFSSDEVSAEQQEINDAANANPVGDISSPQD